MTYMCADNRHEIIAKAKEDMLKSTNIDTSPKEMEVLDNFLFRCWRMGWLDRYDDKLTADAEPVVRCKDCEYWTKQSNSLQGRCALSGSYPTGAWYCANGERREP